MLDTMGFLWSQHAGTEAPRADLEFALLVILFVAYGTRAAHAAPPNMVKTIA